MNDHLIELMFKSVSEVKIGMLLKDLISNNENVSSYSITCNFPKVNWNSEQSIDTVFKQNKNFGLFLNLNTLEKEGIYLSKCGLSVYKYENNIDLEINFQLSDLKTSSIKQTSKRLMKLAKAIANQYEIEKYYCGLEPAEEKETRLFTKQLVGPLFMEYSD